MNRTAAKNNKTKSSPDNGSVDRSAGSCRAHPVYSVINSFGIIGRMSTAAKTDNYSEQEPIKVPEVSAGAEYLPEPVLQLYVLLLRAERLLHRLLR